MCAIAFVDVMCQPDGIFYLFVKWWKKTFGANLVSHVLFECAKCNSAWWMIVLYPLIYREFFYPIEYVVHIMVTVFMAYVMGLMIVVIKR